MGVVLRLLRRVKRNMTLCEECTVLLYGSTEALELVTVQVDPLCCAECGRWIEKWENAYEESSP